jgi:hypothetical protein
MGAVKKRTMLAVVGAASLLGLGAVPATSSATITVGSNLQGTPDTSVQGSLGVLTVLQSFLSPELMAPTPAPTSVDGTVVRWRIRTGDTDTGPVSFRVIRRLSGTNSRGVFTGVATSGPVTPPLNSIATYAANLPISRGDSIAIDCCYPDFGQYFRSTPPSGPLGEIRVWDPALANGDPGRAANDGDNGLEMEVNADVEPTAAFPVPVVTSGKHGRVKVTLQAPNVGTAQAGDARDAALATAANKRKTPLLLKPTTSPVSRPGPIVLVLRPTKVAKRLLAIRKTIKTQLKVTFTPNGGSAFSQTLAVKLKR